MHRPVVLFEIGCKDRGKTSEFYSKMFDWEIDNAGPAARITSSSGQQPDLPGHIVALGHEPHNYVTVYVDVDDVAATLEKAAALGGKTIVPPITIPTGQFAWMADPEGTVIGLFKPNNR
ncbi:MAG: VOC family protein [Bryobacteraceae bacterium]|jgi:predicted enzyme related to lactoylglutathione lyase